MNSFTRAALLPLLSVLLCVLPLDAAAQATRTWVSGVGDDANPCSRTAPCKTFAGAISKTAAGGMINVLDPGGYGGVTITKSITIDGGSRGMGGTLVSGTNAIVINAGAADRVTIRNLSIDGLGTGLSAIRIIAGQSLHVDNVFITGFQKGIDIAPAANTFAYIHNTEIRRTVTGVGIGINIAPTGSGIATVSIDDTRVNEAINGIRITARSLVQISDTLSAGNSEWGLWASTIGPFLEVSVRDSTFDNNGFGAGNGGGIYSTGAASRVRIAGNTVTNNQYGLATYD